MDADTLKTILDSHALWLNGEGGERADLSRADLSGADLSGADLRRADLYGSDLSRADLSGADLGGADLRGADLAAAGLTGANLRWANLSGANLYGADLRRADLSRANLSGAILREANLRGAVLSGADLAAAGLSRAILREANLSGADLRGADLRWANLSGAKWDDSPPPDGWRVVDGTLRGWTTTIPTIDDQPAESIASLRAGFAAMWTEAESARAMRQEIVAASTALSLAGFDGGLIEQVGAALSQVRKMPPNVDAARAVLKWCSAIAHDFTIATSDPLTEADVNRIFAAVYKSGSGAIASASTPAPVCLICDDTGDVTHGTTGSGPCSCAAGQRRNHGSR